MVTENKLLNFNYSVVPADIVEDNDPRKWSIEIIVNASWLLINTVIVNVCDS